MNKSDIKIQGQNLLPWNGSKIDNLIEFLSHFPNSGRCPKNQKRNSEIIKCLKRQIETYAQFGCISDTIGNCLSYYDNISIVELVEAFIKDVPLIKKLPSVMSLLLTTHQWPRRALNEQRQPYPSYLNDSQTFTQMHLKNL